jgi:hypothetical protein
VNYDTNQLQFEEQLLRKVSEKYEVEIKTFGYKFLGFYRFFLLHIFFCIAKKKTDAYFFFAFFKRKKANTFFLQPRLCPGSAGKKSISKTHDFF